MDARQAIGSATGQGTLEWVALVTLVLALLVAVGAAGARARLRRGPRRRGPRARPGGRLRGRDDRPPGRLSQLPRTRLRQWPAERGGLALGHRLPGGELRPRRRLPRRAPPPDRPPRDLLGPAAREPLHPVLALLRGLLEPQGPPADPRPARRRRLPPRRLGELPAED